MIYDLLIVVGVVLSVACVYAAMRIARRKRLLDTLPTSKAL
jgi:hypothetical protein